MRSKGAVLPLAAAWFLAASFAGALVATGCDREKRTFRQSPPVSTTEPAPRSDLRPTPSGSPAPVAGTLPTTPPQPNPEHVAYDVSEGKRLFDWFNCTGCHAHGGGGMGPPLMDARWLYGSDPASIFKTIVEGRPNGMPAYRGKLSDSQVWQLVAYVRSLSGQVAKDVAPSRADHMSAKPSEQEMPRKQPVNAGKPPRKERRP